MIDKKFLVNLLAEHSMDIGEGHYCDQKENESDAEFYKREAKEFLAESSVYANKKKAAKK